MNEPHLIDGMVVMPHDEFETLLERAAERGARHALSDVGLDGPDAARDIRELRSLLDAFNEAKKTAGLTLVKMLVGSRSSPLGRHHRQNQTVRRPAMSPIFTTLAPGLFEAGAKLIDRLIPDPAQREQAKLALFQAEGQQALQEMQVSLSAILAEANSADPWTSRARPTFLYVIYGVILLSVIGSIIGIWWPAEVFQAAENLSKLLNAVPESLWWLFGAGYLGYTGARSFDKWRGVPR